MAKKKAAKKSVPKKQEITEAQLTEIRDKLRNKRGNVYIVATAVVGFEVGEEIFDLLEKGEDGIFKCEQCDIWCNNDLRDPDMNADFCEECVTEMNYDMNPDDGSYDSDSDDFSHAEEE